MVPSGIHSTRPLLRRIVSLQALVSVLMSPSDSCRSLFLRFVYTICSSLKNPRPSTATGRGSPLGRFEIDFLSKCEQLQMGFHVLAKNEFLCPIRNILGLEPLLEFAFLF